MISSPTLSVYDYGYSEYFLGAGDELTSQNEIEETFNT